MSDQIDFKEQYEALRLWADKFKKKVKEMRELQTEYFKRRDNHVLIKSKQVEKEVDEMITPKQSVQATLEWLGI